MSKAKFTPGPWHARIGWPDWNVFSACGASVVSSGSEFDSVSKSDAHLIAAAPDMLAALYIARGKLYNIWFHESDPDDFNARPEIAAIDAAIAKATGLDQGTASVGHGTETSKPEAVKP